MTHKFIIKFISYFHEKRQLNQSSHEVVTANAASYSETALTFGLDICKAHKLKIIQCLDGDRIAAFITGLLTLNFFVQGILQDGTKTPILDLEIPFQMMLKPFLSCLYCRPKVCCP
jgi:hypothetical protein